LYNSNVYISVLLRFHDFISLVTSEGSSKCMKVLLLPREMC